MSSLPRQLKPELEHDYVRSPDLGYESPSESGFIRCLAHGFPTPLARWHHHDEYELHLITATSGKVFVGDWIGHFQPGQVVLTGPRLPHNWVSTDVPAGGVAERDLVIQFLHAPIETGSAHIPELREVLPLLERAKHGIEFFGIYPQALAHWQRVKTHQGLARFGAFCDFLSALAQCTDYRLLSNTQMQSEDNDAQLDQINAILSRISENLESDLLITHIGYQVGFNNIANFNRRFLDIKGMTPSDYRRQAASRFGLKA